MTKTYRIEQVSRLSDIAAQDWDRCAGADVNADGGPSRPANPFLSHCFLDALEASGCASRQTGWAPSHLIATDGDGKIAGAMPCYLKSHSRGEFVFDHAWAHAYERYGKPYYPKLQAAVPFTPVPGRRLLVLPGEQTEAVQEALLAGALQLVREAGLSSFHMTFASEQEWAGLGRKGFLQRTDQQFHWSNQGFATFDDFLQTMASRKRKAVRRERREALCAGITVERVSGSDITEAHWDAFYEFYTDTGARKWGTPYLNREFFSLISESMGDRLLLVMARLGGRYIAGALNVIGADTLFGRYWGAVEHHRFLHFEICYYQAIDFAIERNLARVEAGAQGEHKLARGYLPTPTYSLHYFSDPKFAQAVGDYLGHERSAVDDEIEYYLTHSPFRKDGV